MYTYGQWIPSDTEKGYLTCSSCHDCYIEPGWPGTGKWSFCPHCGADMREIANRMLTLEEVCDIAVRYRGGPAVIWCEVEEKGWTLGEYVLVDMDYEHRDPYPYCISFYTLNGTDFRAYTDCKFLTETYGNVWRCYLYKQRKAD